MNVLFWSWSRLYIAKISVRHIFSLNHRILILKIILNYVLVKFCILFKTLKTNKILSIPAGRVVVAHVIRRCRRTACPGDISLPCHASYKELEAFFGGWIKVLLFKFYLFILVIIIIIMLYFLKCKSTNVFCTYSIIHSITLLRP